MTTTRKWVPEILYEEYEGISEGIPFIQVPKDKDMPDIIFMFGSHETGEFEPNEVGEAQPIVEIELFQYACMQYLKEGLDETTYDQVRTCLGLKPLQEATELGLQKSEKILEKK
tara:strand:- start:397 stop:738 length:342 start_codon:yes stop_codon:yes gene_type:complete